MGVCCWNLALRQEHVRTAASRSSSSEFSEFLFPGLLPNQSSSWAGSFAAIGSLSKTRKWVKNSHPTRDGMRIRISISFAKAGNNLRPWNLCALDCFDLQTVMLFAVVEFAHHFAFISHKSRCDRYCAIHYEIIGALGPQNNNVCHNSEIFGFLAPHNYLPGSLANQFRYATSHC